MMITVLRCDPTIQRHIDNIENRDNKDSYDYYYDYYCC